MLKLPLGGLQDRAQSSTIGVILVLGITLSLASAIVVFGSVAIEEGQQQARVGQAEQSMTQFDARAAQVALGASDSQQIQFGQARGTYHVNETAGRVKVFHDEWNGSGTSELIYEDDLGAVYFEAEGTTIAYQGGGVWKRTGDNETATMVSPPEFHNRDATLTFPIVRVRGTDSASGRQTATIVGVGSSAPIFPDLDGETTAISNQYDTDSDQIYENPVTEGNMTVEIESEYCNAWKRYFETRTEGNVSDCSNDVVTAQIYASGTQGSFDIAGSNEIKVRGVQELEEFVIRMEESDTGSSSFNRLDWTLNASNENGDFSIHFGGASPVDCGAAVPGTVTWENDTMSHEWSNDTEFELWGPDCPSSDDNLYLEVDLLNDSVDMNKATSGDATINGTVYNQSNPAPLGELIRHYFDVMGDMDVLIDEGNNAFLSDTSSGTLQYEGSGRVITYLHITENEIAVSFD